MNKLTRDERASILHLLCEGNSIRAVTRLTGSSKKAVSRLMVDAGQAADWYQDRVFRNLTCKRVQVDEIWAFVYAKQRNVATAKKAPADAGDVWTWTAIDADTKLIPTWFIGSRDSDSAATRRRSRSGSSSRLSATSSTTGSPSTVTRKAAISSPNSRAQEPDEASDFSAKIRSSGSDSRCAR